MSVDRVCEMVVLRWLFSGLCCAVDSEEANGGADHGKRVASRFPRTRAACSEPNIDNTRCALRPLNPRHIHAHHGRYNDARRFQRSLRRFKLHYHTQWLV